MAGKESARNRLGRCAQSSFAVALVLLSIGQADAFQSQVGTPSPVHESTPWNALRS